MSTYRYRAQCHTIPFEWAISAVVSSLSDSFGILVGLLICVCALGAVQGLILTGSRITHTFALDTSLFSVLSYWNPRYGGPVNALWLQALLSSAIVVLTGSFKQTVLYTAAVVWFFYAATGVSCFVLRRKHKERSRPYTAYGYPVSVLIFILSCLFLIYNGAIYDVKGTLISTGIVLSGIPVYLYSKREKSRSQPAS